MESGAGSTMLKLGLLLVLANIFLKLFIGIGLWKMAMEVKSSRIKSSIKYEEEQINEGDPYILRGKKNEDNKQDEIKHSNEQNDILEESNKEEV